MCSDLNKVKAGNASLKVKLKEDISMALESLTVDNITQKSSAKCCKSLTEVAERHYGDDTTSFIDDLHHLFSRNGVNVPCLSKEDFVYLLKKFQNKQYFDECLKAAYCAKHALTPLELVYFQAKFSGTALFNELHKILPGIFPSHYTGIAPRLVAAGKWLSCGPGERWNQYLRPRHTQWGAQLPGQLMWPTRCGGYGSLTHSTHPAIPMADCSPWFIAAGIPQSGLGQESGIFYFQQTT